LTKACGHSKRAVTAYQIPPFSFLKVQRGGSLLVLLVPIVELWRGENGVHWGVAIDDVPSDTPPIAEIKHLFGKERKVAINESQI
jgi:hypothetical protein